MNTVCVPGCPVQAGGDHEPECITYVATGSLWRSLTYAEEQEFRAWARANHTDDPSPLWHPVVREEMAER